MSGGDPLSLSNRRLRDLVSELETIESVTTVRIHKETLGETALGLLAEGLTGAVEEIPPRTLVPTELVVRASA